MSPKRSLSYCKFRSVLWSAPSKSALPAPKNQQINVNKLAFDGVFRTSLKLAGQLLHLRSGKGECGMGRLNRQLNPAQTGHEAETLEAELRKRVVGQDEAVQQIVGIYQTHLAGMSTPGRPIGNLLFLGPTGSGKTRLVEAVAEAMYGDPRAMIKIDCAEF